MHEVSHKCNLLKSSYSFRKVLKNFTEKYYSEAKNDLATVFLERCLELCVYGGTSSIVLPQNWLFLTSYKKFRRKLLKEDTWNMIARLGAKGFQTPMWDFNVQLISISSGQFDNTNFTGKDKINTYNQLFHGVDVSGYKTVVEKESALMTTELKPIEQAKQLDNPDVRVLFEKQSQNRLDIYLQ
jgi:hypothetical protein